MFGLYLLPVEASTDVINHSGGNDCGHNDRYNDHYTFFLSKKVLLLLRKSQTFWTEFLKCMSVCSHNKHKVRHLCY